MIEVADSRGMHSAVGGQQNSSVMSGQRTEAGSEQVSDCRRMREGGRGWWRAEGECAQAGRRSKGARRKNLCDGVGRMSYRQPEGAFRKGFLDALLFVRTA